MQKSVIFLLVFILPICLVLLVDPKWLGRLIALAYVLPFGVLVLLFNGLNPKAKYIPNKAKLNRPEYTKHKKYIVYFIRCCLVIMAFSIVFEGLLPFYRGAYSLLENRKVYVETGIISNVIVPFPLLEFIKQEVVLTDKTNTKYYNYFYSFGPRLKKGETYKFVILPSSNIILDAQMMPQIQDGMDGVD